MARSRRNCLFMAALAAGGVTAATITAESGLDFFDGLTLPDEVFTAEEGATIRVAGADPARAGLNLHTDSAVVKLELIGQLRSPVVGTDCGAWTNLFFDANVTNDAPAGTWTYRGRWHAPSTGLYSFAGSCDDRVGLVIDGRSVLAVESTNLATRQDVPLERGWHDIQIMFVNQWAALGVWNELARSLVWSPDNLAFARDNLDAGRLFEDPGDGSCLQTLNNGTFCRKLDIPSGTATLDLTASELAGTFCFGAFTGLHTGEGAKLRVCGATNLLFNGLSTGVHFPLLDADVEFADNPDGTVRVAGKASIERLRPNYVIEDDSEIAYWGTNMVTDAVWTLTNHDAWLISTTAVSSAKIAIADGRRLTLKPCRHNEANFWEWKGLAGVFTNDFELAGTESLLELRSYRALEVAGRITGSGVVRVADQILETPTRLTGDLSDFSGTYLAVEHGELSIDGTLPAGGVPALAFNGQGGTIRFNPAGAGETDTAVLVRRVAGSTEDGCLLAGVRQEVTVASFGGTASVETANLTDSHVTVESLEAGATLVLRASANVTVNSFAPGATVRAQSGIGKEGRLTLVPESGQLDTLVVTPGSVLTLAGTGTVANVQGEGTVILAEQAVVLNAQPGIIIRTAAGAVVRDIDVAALESALGAKPALWLDASRKDTMQQYLNCVFTNGMLIRRWNDCRAGQTELYGLNTRGEGYARVYPYVMTNALNGMDVVSCGAVGGTIESRYGHVNVTTGEPVDDPNTMQNETRRLPFNRPIKVRTAILVFGSHTPRARPSACPPRSSAS
ncbi:MAG: hypothetical protein ACI4Q3_01355 [Kiritimatiellia bacterium]